jgi:hypothetical protein
MHKFTIQDRTVTLPVEIRKARSWAATFTVDATATQALIASTGLEVAQMRPGKAIASLAAVRYEDGDLDRYNEVAVAFVVRRHDAPDATPGRKALEVARNRTGVYIHHLPVDQSFTLEAGRTIWGYPKFLADIRIDERPKETRITLRDDGAHVFTLTVRPGVRVPFGLPNLPTYTHMDDVLRCTAWETFPEGTRARPGGAALELGTHPIADELRSVGLPHRALMSTMIPNVRARFGSAEIVQPAAAAAR